MRSERNRVSRGLIVVLGAVVGVGAVSVAYNVKRTRSAVGASTSTGGHTPVVTSVLPKTTAPAGETAVATAGPVTPAAPIKTTLAPPVPSAAFQQILSDAKEKLDGGHPIEARETLNAALLRGGLTPDDSEAARRQLTDINQKLIFSPTAAPNDPWASIYAIQPGEPLARTAYRNAVTWELLTRINGVSDPRRVRAGQKVKVVKGPFHAVVNKKAFRMDLYLGSPGEAGSMYVMSYPVGLGKDDSTPTGKWLVEPGKKIKNPKYYSPRGEGVIDANDPKNPLGEYWIALQGMDGQAVGKLSYGIHGTIEPNSIGTQASMGCIRMRNEDVERVYELLVDGKSTVIVKE